MFLRKTIFGILACGFCFTAMGAQRADAAVATTTPARTLKVQSAFSDTDATNGRTVTTPKGAFSIGIQPQAFSATSVNPNVELHTRKPKRIRARKRKFLKKLRSRVFEYELSPRKQVQLEKPVWVSIGVKGEWTDDLVVKRYNSKKRKWVPLETTLDPTNKRAKVTIQRKRAILAVFKTQPANVEVRTGVASWHDFHAAAMNNVPFGTIVTVTNPETGESTQVAVGSTGPFVPGRIIDLPRETFQALAPLSRGVMHVEVQIPQ